MPQERAGSAALWRMSAVFPWKTAASIRLGRAGGKADVCPGAPVVFRAPRNRRYALGSVLRPGLFRCAPRQHAFGKPCAHRFVIKLQAPVGHGNADEQDAHRHGESAGKGHFRIVHPGQVQVNDGVVGDVKGVGDVSQESAGPGGDVAWDVAGSQKDHRGEDDDDAEGVIQAVQAEVFRPAHVRHGQRSHQKQAAPPEAVPDPAGLAQAEQEQAAEEGEHEPRQSHAALFHVQRPAADVVALRVALVDEGAGRQEDQDRQPPAGEFPDEHGVKDVGDVFEEEGPGRTVQRVHFRPSANIQGNGDGQQREPHGHDQQHFPYGGLCDVREDFRPLEVKEGSTQQHPHDHHGLKAHQPPLAEIPQAHLSPAVVIGIPDDEAGQHEEEVHGQIAVIDDLVRVELEVPGASFKHVEQDHHDGGYAAQAVQGGIMRFGSQNGGRERGRSAHGISTAKSDCAYRKRGDAYFTCAAAEPRNGFFRRESPGTGWY